MSTTKPGDRCFMVVIRDRGRAYASGAPEVHLPGRPESFWLELTGEGFAAARVLLRAIDSHEDSAEQPHAEPRQPISPEDMQKLRAELLDAYWQKIPTAQAIVSMLMTVHPEAEPLSTSATRYPPGTTLQSVCPDCLRVGEKVIERTWCWWCLVERGEWIRVAWGRGGIRDSHA